MRCRFVIMVLLVTLLFSWITAIPNVFSQDATDDEIKAALIFKFPIYVKWPDSVMNDTVETFTCCVLGEGKICDLLLFFDGEELMGKTIHVKRLSNADALDSCHMLFVGYSRKENLSKLLSAAEKRHILTIGDMKGFAQKGGVINFIRKKDSIRFEVNPNAGKRAGLKLSSKLLRLAEIVEDR